MSVGNELSIENLFKSSNIRKVEQEDGGSLVELKASHGPGKTERIICFTEKWFVERDASSYTVKYARALNDVIHILRGRDAMEVVVTFADGNQRVYYTSQREAFIATLFDCSLAAKADPIISDIPRFGSLIIEKMTASECGQSELTLLKNIANFDPTKITGIEPVELFMIHVFLLNNNMPPSGPQFAEASRSKLIIQALEKLLTIGKPGEGFLQCLHRLLSTRIGYESFVENKRITEKVTEVIGMALQSVKPIVLFWALRITSILLCSSADENIEKKGKLEVMTHGIPERIFATLVGNIKKGSPLVIHGCVTAFKYIVCEPYSYTTEFNMFNRMMNIISGLGRDVFMLFQSPCISIPHIAGQILRALVEETDMDERIKELQDYALLEGTTLKYLQIACFSTPKTTTQLLQKHLALHLLDVFTADHKESESVLKRTIPSALLSYLDSPDQPPEKLDITDDERQHPRHQMSTVASFWKKWNVRRSTNENEIRTRQKRVIKQKRNWGMLVFQLHQQHRRADLIWNHQTREELKEAIDNEIRQLKKDQEEGEVAWNYREFIVEYHSLDNEVCVDGCFIKCLLEKGEITLSDPRDFFDTLYHRCLFETNRELQALAIQSMSVIYRKFNKEIGAFKDISHIVSMLRMTRSLLLRDRLIELLDSLLKVEINARTFIDVGGIDLYVDLLILVHLHADHAIIPLQTNLLTSGTTIGEWYYVEINNNKKEKKGPVSLDKLKELLNQNIIQETTMVWAQGMEDWKILKDITLLKWALLTEDTGILTPIELCQSISKTLEDLVTMYPSRDMHGILLRPIPRAKRILSSPRHLPHIVQLLLTAAPTIVDTAARLLKNLLEDNPTAQPKFYLTGVFYFALMYSGSNLKEISRLLYATHRQQKIGEAVELSVLKPLIPHH
ncbi:Hypothetical protein EHI5A_169700 [Entamoeba histolytica KU27]|uniref:Uncharacterized protein n=1 Tax=Entamoeba histolytica KU27 TaxID=885311 RepID=M2R1M4_ENTHI|nr:Hypothetical protein EHI5A_169700 [Entamoeba histolytica KU27]